MSEKQKDSSQNPAGVSADEQLVFQMRDEAERTLGPDAALGSRSAEPEIEALARRAVVRLVPGIHHSPSDAWSETGGGDKQKEKIDYLKQELFNRVAEVDSSYSEVNHDKNVHMVLQGLRNIYGIADTPGQSIETFVKEKVKALKDTADESFARNSSVRDYDSLSTLGSAFKKIITNSQGERSEELVEDFFEDLFPSDVWSKPGVKQLVLEATDIAYQLVGIMSSPNAESIDNFIFKARNEFLEQGAGLVAPRKRSSHQAKASFKRNLANARVMAWQEWRNGANTAG